MSEIQRRIVIAGLPDPWLDAVVDGLEADQQQVERIREGDELAQLLGSADPVAHTLVLGAKLAGLSAPDALALAAKRLGKEVSASRLGFVNVVLLTEVKQDERYHDLFRSRGVTHFVHPDGSPQQVVATLLALVHATTRAARRVTMAVQARVDLRGQRLDVTIGDIAEGGAQLLFPSKKLSPPAAAGERLELHLPLISPSVQCSAIIRRVTHQARFFGDKTVLGVQFVDLTDEHAQAFKRFIAQVEEMSAQAMISAFVA